MHYHNDNMAAGSNNCFKKNYKHSKKIGQLVFTRIKIIVFCLNKEYIF